MNKRSKHLHYGDKIQLMTTDCNYIHCIGYICQHLRFFDQNVYLSAQKKPESIFTIQSKENGSICINNENVSVVFGTQILIRHYISKSFIGIKVDQGSLFIKEGITQLRLFEQESSECLFLFEPVRSFQLQGDLISDESQFIIKNVISNEFLSDGRNELLYYLLKEKISNMVLQNEEIDQEIGINNQSDNILFNEQKIDSETTNEVVMKLYSMMNNSFNSQQRYNYYKEILCFKFQEIKFAITDFLRMNFSPFQSLNQTQFNIQQGLLRLNQDLFEFTKNQKIEGYWNVKESTQQLMTQSYQIINTSIQKIKLIQKIIKQHFQIFQTQSSINHLVRTTKQINYTFKMLHLDLILIIQGAQKQLQTIKDSEFNQTQLMDQFKQEVKEIVKQSEIKNGAKIDQPMKEDAAKNLIKQVQDLIQQKIEYLKNQCQIKAKYLKSIHQLMDKVKVKSNSILSQIKLNQITMQFFSNQINSTANILKNVNNELANIQTLFQEKLVKIRLIKDKLTNSQYKANSKLTFILSFKILVTQIKQMLCLKKAEADQIFRQKRSQINNNSNFNQLCLIIQQFFENWQNLLTNVQVKVLAKSQINEEKQESYQKVFFRNIAEVQKNCKKRVQQITKRITFQEKEITQIAVLILKKFNQVHEQFQKIYKLAPENSIIIKKINGLKAQGIQWNQEFVFIMGYEFLINYLKKYQQKLIQQCKNHQIGLIDEIKQFLQFFKKLINQAEYKVPIYSQIVDINFKSLSQENFQYLQHFIKIMNKIKLQIQLLIIQSIKLQDNFNQRSKFNQFSFSSSRQLSLGLVNNFMDIIQRKYLKIQSKLNFLKKMHKIFPQCQKIHLFTQEIIQRLPSVLIKKKFIGKNLKNILRNTEIFRSNNGLQRCSSNTRKVALIFNFKKTYQSKGFLDTEDYIYFVHSFEDKVLTVNISQQLQIEYKDKDNQNVHLSSLFEVEIQNEEEVYLRHLLSNKYFPFENDQTIKKRLTLESLITYNKSKNKSLPFNIYFDNQLFQKNVTNKDGFHLEENYHGFWIKKKSRKSTSWIRSIRNLDCSIWVPKILYYLSDDKQTKKTKIFQFGLIQYLLVLIKILPKGKLLNQICRLLFIITKDNPENKKLCHSYLNYLLQNMRKVNLLCLLNQLLIEQTNGFNLTNLINTEAIKHLAHEFQQNNEFSCYYLRVFRALCGPQLKPYQKNQKIIFNMFFAKKYEQLCKKSSFIEQGNEKLLILQGKFRFQIYQNSLQGLIIGNSEQRLNFSSFSLSKKEYIRQYFYLIADCIQSNEESLKQFKVHYSLSMMISAFIKAQAQLKSPLLKIIYVAYLEPDKRYSLYVFHPEYQKIVTENQMLCRKNNKHQQQFVKQLIQYFNKEYLDLYSTELRIYLKSVNISIKNGYWSSLKQIQIIIQKTINLLDAPEFNIHQTYEQKNTNKNLISSKITAVKLRSLYLDLAINIFIQSLINTEFEDQVEYKIRNFLKQLKWKVTKRLLKLCSSKNKKLLKQSINLMYNLYNLNSIIRQRYHSAKKDMKCNLDSKIYDCFSSYRFPLKARQQIFKIISACIPKVKIQNITQQGLNQKAYFTLGNVFQYLETNEQIQNISFKLKIHLYLLSDIQKYHAYPLNKKNSEAKEYIYWRLVALYALITNNKIGRQLIIPNRQLLLPFLNQSEHSMLFYIASDILEEIYQTNRRLIIKGTNNQLCQICKSLNLSLFGSKDISIKDCKLLSLVSIFISCGKRKLYNNFQTIIENLFTKQKILFMMDTMHSLSIRYGGFLSLAHKDFKESCKFKLNYLFCILVYCVVAETGKSYFSELVVQNQLFLYNSGSPSSGYIYRLFQPPPIKQTISLIQQIGYSNWLLKGKIFQCINLKQKASILQIKHLFNNILSEIQYICQCIINKSNKNTQFSHEKHLSKQVRAYIKIVNSIIVVIIDGLEIVGQFFNDAIKVVERMFLIRQICSLAVNNEIKSLQSSLYPMKKLKEKIFLIISKGTANSSHLMTVKNQQTLNYIISNLLDRLTISEYTIEDLRQQFYSQTKLLIFDLLKGLQKQSIEDIQDHLSQKNKRVYAYNQQVIVNHLQNDPQIMTNFLQSLSKINNQDKLAITDKVKEFILIFITESFFNKILTQEDPLYGILKSGNLTTIICTIISEKFDQRYSLFEKTFQFAVKLLQIGKEQCQSDFIKKLLINKSNQIFKNIALIIKEGVRTLQFYYNSDGETFFQYDLTLHDDQVNTCRQERRSCSNMLSNIFKYIQILLTSTNLQFKSYIYNQQVNPNLHHSDSVNFLELLVNVFNQLFNLIACNIKPIRNNFNNSFSQEISQNLFELPCKILDLIVLYCKSYRFNHKIIESQLFLCRTNFFNIISRIRQVRYKVGESINLLTTKVSKNILFYLEKRLVLLILNMIEQNHPQLTNRLSKILKKHDFQFLIEQSFLHGSIKQHYGISNQLKNYQNNQFWQNIIYIIVILKNFSNKQKLNLQPFQLQTIYRIDHKIKTVSVNFQGKKVTAHFPFFLEQDISQNTKQFLLNKLAVIQTRCQRLQGMIESKSIIYEYLQRFKQSKLLNESKIIHIFHFNLAFCFIILTLLVLSYTIQNSTLKIHVVDYNFLLNLSIIEIFFALFYAVIFGIYTAPMSIQKLHFQKSINLSKSQNSKYSFFTTIFQFLYKKILYLKAIYYDEFFSFHSVFLVIISLVATFWDLRAYSLIVLILFSNIQMLTNIISSLSLSWKQLGIILILSLILAFIFGFMSLNYYLNSIDQEQQNHCSSVVMCLKSLYTQQVIGSAIHKNQDFFYRRFAFDNIYWILFEIIIGNVIAGIIIDKFAQERDLRIKVNQIRKSKCLICQVSMESMQKREQIFEKHIHQSHNLWNYYFYMYMIEKIKKQKQLTIVELWVRDNIVQSKTDWLPIEDDANILIEEEDESLSPTIQKNKKQEIKHEEIKISPSPSLRKLDSFKPLNRFNSIYSQNNYVGAFNEEKNKDQQQNKIQKSKQQNNIQSLFLETQLKLQIMNHKIQKSLTDILAEIHLIKSEKHFKDNN